MEAVAIVRSVKWQPSYVLVTCVKFRRGSDVQGTHDSELAQGLLVTAGWNISHTKIQSDGEIWITSALNTRRSGEKVALFLHKMQTI